MNLLVVGAGKGSWEIRGIQLGRELGARVVSEPSQADWRWAQLGILVKRHGARHAGAARAAGCPVVWDALDCWRQPWDNALSPQAAQGALAAQAAFVGAVLNIGATGAQATALGGEYLPHHCWPDLAPAPARREMRVVAYQGNAAYLGAFGPALRDACRARGLAFEINPADLRTADLVVALREGPWDGWACRQWKSGVKIVNAFSAGRPVLTQATAAAQEIDAPGTVIETIADLGSAIDAWLPFETREAAAVRCAAMAPAYTLDAVAGAYRGMLERAMREPCTVA